MGFLLEVVFGVFFCLTGEIILFILSLGRYKPHWDRYTAESPVRSFILSEISTWIGMVFWFAALVLLIKFVVTN